MELQIGLAQWVALQSFKATVELFIMFVCRSAMLCQIAQIALITCQYCDSSFHYHSNKPILFEAFSASSPACRIPMEVLMRRSSEMARRRSPDGFSSSIEITYSG